VDQPSSLDQHVLIEPVLRVEGVAELSFENLAGQSGNNDVGNQHRSTAREKLTLMNEYVGEENGDNIQCLTDSQDRCFIVRIL
jgi:hypothetical protein